MSVSTTVHALEAAPASRRHNLGFWLVAMAFSTVPTPLYAIYQQQDGFSTLTVTIMFGIYAVGVATSLLLARSRRSGGPAGPPRPTTTAMPADPSRTS